MFQIDRRIFIRPAPVCRRDPEKKRLTFDSKPGWSSSVRILRGGGKRKKAEALTPRRLGIIWRIPSNLQVFPRGRHDQLAMLHAFGADQLVRDFPQDGGFPPFGVFP